MLCQALPSGTGRDEEGNLQLFNSLFLSAAEQLTVCTPYFVPEDSMYNALRATARRGVALSTECNRHIVEASIQACDRMRAQTGIQHQIIAAACSSLIAFGTLTRRAAGTLRTSA